MGCGRARPSPFLHGCRDECADARAGVGSHPSLTYSILSCLPESPFTSLCRVRASGDAADGRAAVNTCAMEETLLFAAPPTSVLAHKAEWGRRAWAPRRVGSRPRFFSFLRCHGASCPPPFFSPPPGCLSFQARQPVNHISQRQAGAHARGAAGRDACDVFLFRRHRHHRLTVLPLAAPLVGAARGVCGGLRSLA